MPVDVGAPLGDVGGVHAGQPGARHPELIVVPFGAQEARLAGAHAHAGAGQHLGVRLRFGEGQDGK